MSSQAAVVVKAFREMIDAEDPTFVFTSIQVVVNSRAQLHVDAGNVGPSVAVALGPMVGGQLCFASDAAGGLSIGEPGKLVRFCGKAPHFVLPFAGTRVALVAYCHEAVFTTQARGLIDGLVKAGFRPPPDAGTVKVFPRSSSADEAVKDATWQSYANACEEVAHIATSKTARQVGNERHNGGFGGTRTWGFLSKWLLTCIFASVIADQSVRGDEAWHDRSIGGGRVRYTGRAYPCTDGGVHSAAARRMMDGKGSWTLYGSGPNDTAGGGNTMLRTPEAHNMHEEFKEFEADTEGDTALERGLCKGAAAYGVRSMSSGLQDLVSNCNVPVTRGAGDDRRWLDIDPLASCKRLFQHQFILWDSLDAVRLKHSTKEALRHFAKEPHAPEDVAEILLHVDGGGKRRRGTEEMPATWAVVVSTVGRDGTYAVKHFFGGSVVVDAGDRSYLGAQRETSMTAEVSAQVMAGLYIVADQLGVGRKVPITIVYDNEVAAKIRKVGGRHRT